MTCRLALTSDSLCFFFFLRMFYVASREGQLPEVLSMVHVHRHTPVAAVIVLVSHADTLNHFLYLTKQLLHSFCVFSDSGANFLVESAFVFAVACQFDVTDYVMTHRYKVKLGKKNTYNEFCC